MLEALDQIKRNASEFLRITAGRSEEMHDRSKDLHAAITETVRIMHTCDWSSLEGALRRDLERSAKSIQFNLINVLDCLEVGETSQEREAYLALAQSISGAYDSLHKYGVDALHDPAVRQEVYDLTGGTCAYCDCELPPNWHVDHLVPKSMGGPDNFANYVPSCPSCNMSKSNGHVIEFVKKARTKFVGPLRFVSSGSAA